MIDTTPRADDQPDNADSPVEIEVNPGSMPAWTRDRSDMSVLVDQGMLSALEERWRSSSPRLTDRLRPGLSDAAIDHTVAALELEVPNEVRQWYRWHDGSVGPAIIFARSFDPFASAVARTLELRTEDESWPRGWVKVMDEKPYLIFDCRGERPAPVPVWHFDYSFDFDRPARPVFDSVGDMVSFWIELIDSGLIFWDAEGEQRWR